MKKGKGLKNKFPSELRFDIVSGDWVLIATGRAKRPEAFAIGEKKKIRISRKECPFCHIGSQEKPILIFSRGKKIEKAVNWTTIVIPNKYPALAPDRKPHPHSQIITTPLIDVDLRKALYYSKKYFYENKKCLYCQMNNWERRVKKRIVFENNDFLALCPFASKSAFEVIISPKFHSPYFEKITEEQKLGLAEAFQVVMKKLKSALNDPPYNFYLHTAPCDGRDYSFYHWHWTILPKTSIMAGFELGARIEISTIQPEKAAEYLRKVP